MIVPLIALLQLTATVPQAPADSAPRVTLAEALQRASRFDPEYVRALGQVDQAEWGRRAARIAFIAPALSLSLDATKYDRPFFNIGTSGLTSTSVTAQWNARYELFSGRKFADLGRTAAELESATAGELQSRFATALLTESDYYAVLADQELTRVESERVTRAESQLAVARARVTSGGAVQTDSLQLRLELTRARVGLLRQAAALRTARLELGRRVGISGPVDAVPLDTMPASQLPLGLAEAVDRTLRQGPEYRVARANERAAAAFYQGRRGTYLPVLTLSANNSRFDNHLFPSASVVTSVSFGVSLPLWDNGNREIALTQARVNRDVSRTVREDLERAALRDVTEAYDAYETARASTDLAQQAVLVAVENNRVQELRYRSGATTILDLLEAQAGLTAAQSDLVQSRYANRLALAGLEAMLGQRLFSGKQ
ncbi:MAG: TolC family protein [Gemmatimonadota bacterium]